jgi:L-threonylcarbamoyladenylate synthase
MKTALQVAAAFADSDVFVLDGKVGNLNQETAIYDVLTGERLR